MRAPGLNYQSRTNESPRRQPPLADAFCGNANQTEPSPATAGEGRVRTPGSFTLPEKYKPPRRLPPLALRLSQPTEGKRGTVQGCLGGRWDRGLRFGATYKMSRRCTETRPRTTGMTAQARRRASAAWAPASLPAPWLLSESLAAAGAPGASGGSVSCPRCRT